MKCLFWCCLEAQGWHLEKGGEGGLNEWWGQSGGGAGPLRKLVVKEVGGCGMGVIPLTEGEGGF